MIDFVPLAKAKRQKISSPQNLLKTILCHRIQPALKVEKSQLKIRKLFRYPLPSDSSDGPVKHKKTTLIFQNGFQLF